LRRRGERVERSFAHAYDTGGMRRTHLRGTTNILKRVLVHASGFNLGLVMRRLLGVGTPRGFQGRLTALIRLLLGVSRAITVLVRARSGHARQSRLRADGPTAADFVIRPPVENQHFYHGLLVSCNSETCNK
jgi:transposase